jgi:hypothetical protein
MVRRLSILFAVSLSVILSASFASADTVDFLNFNYVKDGQQIGNFYDGGGNSGVPNFGITFSSSVYGLRSEFQDGSGSFMPDPTNTPAIFMEGAYGSTVSGTMNVAGGFSSGINFLYTAAFQTTVTVWSGANGTGSVLATIALAPNNAGCTIVSLCNWSVAGLSFSGTAGSVTFSGPAYSLGLTDITVGQSTSIIPEPSSMYLLATGIVGFGLPGMRRFLKR